MPKFNVNKAVTEIGSNEISSKRRKRFFSAKEKLRIIKEIETCKHGEAGAILRREGIYSSYISDWRRELNLRGISGLSAGTQPGPKPKDEKDNEIIELKKRTAALQSKLDMAHALLELQKKAFELLELKPANDKSAS